jgi:hypothetical protein
LTRSLIPSGEREDDEVVGRDDALLSLERRELLGIWRKVRLLNPEESEHARRGRRQELLLKLGDAITDAGELAAASSKAVPEPPLGLVRRSV